VAGIGERENKMHKVMLYALSTCGWCKRTKQFLDTHGVAYDYLYVDLLGGDEKRDAMTEVRRWNQRESFPTIVIDGANAIVGFDEDRLREVLEL
jgi:glutaredoxin-like protein NrdH